MCGRSHHAWAGASCTMLCSQGRRLRRRSTRIRDELSLIQDEAVATSLRVECRRSENAITDCNVTSIIQARDKLLRICEIRAILESSTGTDLCPHTVQRQRALTVLLPCAVSRAALHRQDPAAVHTSCCCACSRRVCDITKSAALRRSAAARGPRTHSILLCFVHTTRRAHTPA